MFDLNKIYHFGEGSLGDVSVEDGATVKINSYARVTDFTANTVTFDKDNALLGDFEKFSAGNVILIHVSAGSKTDYLGKFLFAKILLTEDNILTVDKDFSQILPTTELENYFVQIVTCADFDCLKLKSGAIIAPTSYNPYHYHGGILVLKCLNNLIFDGGNISLTDCGIPCNKKDLRPTLDLEKNAVLDSDTNAGEENFLADRFLLNAGDGAAFIFAKNIISNKNARIGNLNSHGKPLCRGADDSTFKPSNVTNIGGAGILIAAETIQNFSPTLISKYREKSSSLSEIGQGLAHAFIALDNPLKQDGKLFASDFISNDFRLHDKFNLHGFGDSSAGDWTNPPFQLNKSAKIYFCQNDKYFFESDSGRAAGAFLPGSQIILKNNTDFVFAKILSVEEDYFVADTVFNATIAYSCPEFANFTLNKHFISKNVFALFSGDSCDLSGAEIDAELIFIVAKNLTFNSLSKLNAQTFICADSISGLTDDIFAVKGNLVFVNEVI